MQSPPGRQLAAGKDTLLNTAGVLELHQTADGRWAPHLKASFSSHIGAVDCQMTAECSTLAPMDTRAKGCVARSSPTSPSACVQVLSEVTSLRQSGTAGNEAVIHDLPERRSDAAVIVHLRESRSEAAAPQDAAADVQRL